MNRSNMSTSHDNADLVEALKMATKRTIEPKIGSIKRFALKTYLSYIKEDGRRAFVVASLYGYLCRCNKVTPDKSMLTSLFHNRFGDGIEFPIELCSLWKAFSRNGLTIDMSGRSSIDTMVSKLPDYMLYKERASMVDDFLRVVKAVDRTPVPS